MQTEMNRCPKCQTPLPADAPQGLCPKCLLAAVANPTETGSLPRGGSPAPSLEAIAAAFPQLEILELFGQGGMGFIFKARQPKLDRFVALKILPQALAADPSFAERFNREARLLARLNHPNIVTVHDFGQSGEFFYLLMEFVDGVNLRQAMQAGRFTPAQALAIVPKICEALQFAHNEGILHRDIKPENILLDAKGRVKIADFGIAKLIGDSGQEKTATAQGEKSLVEGDSLTEAGKALGTPNYMAPEQRDHPQSVDNRADIYSLGVVFYEMLTGELPVGRFAPPSQKSAADPRVDAVVARALEREKEKRFASADEVKTRVETISASAGIPSTGKTGEAKSDAPPVVYATKKRKGEYFGVECVMQAIGLVCCLYVPLIGIPLGLVLLMIGGRMALKLVCSNCRHTTTEAVKICADCGAHFEKPISTTQRSGSEPEGSSPPRWLIWSPSHSSIVQKAIIGFAGLMLLLYAYDKLVIRHHSARKVGQPAQNQAIPRIVPTRQQVAGFGAVVECVVDVTKPGGYDLDNGRFIEVPLKDYTNGVGWMQSFGKDLIVWYLTGTNATKAISLSFVDMKPTEVEESYWSKSPDEILNDTRFTVMRVATAEQASSTKTKLWVWPSRNPRDVSDTPTYLFETREGGMGVLQITGLTENPDGVKIRYKLIHGIQPTPSQPTAAEVTSASAETWSPTLSPGEKPDFEKMRQEAKDAMSQGRYEEALLRHIWYHNHALEYDQAQTGVRLSFWLADWIELGRRYPRAWQALIEIRDEKTRKLVEGGGYSQLFSDVVSINGYLQDDEASYALFKTVQKRDPALAQQCYFYVENLLVKKGEYELCFNYMGDPQRRFESNRSTWEIQKRMYQRRANLPDPTNMPAGIAPRMDMMREADKRFVRNMNQLIEILVGAGHKAEAEKIRDQALVLLDDAELKTAVEDMEKKIHK
jgi:serine/threonine protein kinase